MQSKGGGTSQRCKRRPQSEWTDNGWCQFQLIGGFIVVESSLAIHQIKPSLSWSLPMNNIIKGSLQIPSTSGHLFNNIHQQQQQHQRLLQADNVPLSCVLLFSPFPHFRDHSQANAIKLMDFHVPSFWGLHIGRWCAWMNKRHCCVLRSGSLKMQLNSSKRNFYLSDIYIAEEIKLQW